MQMSDWWPRIEKGKPAFMSRGKPVYAWYYPNAVDFYDYGTGRLITVLVVKYPDGWYITPASEDDDDVVGDVGPFETAEQAISVILLGAP
jgi:hypothetical protein